jgi:hypothetical protein
MISSKLFLFIERVVAAEMDIIVQRGFVHLGSCGGSRATAKMWNYLSAQLTDDLKAEIVDVFVEGEFDRRYLAEFLTKEPPDSVAHLWPEFVRTRSSP